MNTARLLSITLLALVAGFSVQAQELYELNLRLKCKVLNDDGKIVIRHLNSKDLINRCADDHGIAQTNRRPLKLVYNRHGVFNGDLIQVVNRDTGQTVCEVFRLSFGQGLTNAAGTLVERQTYLFNDLQSEQVGSALVTERIKPDKTIIRGVIHLGLPSQNEDGTAVCSGTFNTGKPVVLPTPE